MIHSNRHQLSFEAAMENMQRRVAEHIRWSAKKHAKALAVTCPMCGYVGKLNFQSGKASCLKCAAYVNQKAVVRRIKGGRDGQ